MYISPLTWPYPVVSLPIISQLFLPRALSPGMTIINQEKRRKKKKKKEMQNQIQNSDVAPFLISLHSLAVTERTVYSRTSLRWFGNGKRVRSDSIIQLFSSSSQGAAPPISIFPSLNFFALSSSFFRSA